MRRYKRLVSGIVLVMLITAAALSATGIAAAQASPRYDLACWGVTTAGGGIRTINSAGANQTRFTLMDSAGQWMVGDSTSAQYTVRSGYMAPFFRMPSTGAAVNPVLGAADIEIYLPFLSYDLRLVYVCPY